jgi:serine phosphatase RsbU (regulator of sigma subunit)
VPQIPLAMFEERRFTAARVACEPGDLFVIVTDGLVEVFDKRDREFGFDRLKAIVVEHAQARCRR